MTAFTKASGLGKQTLNPSVTTAIVDTRDSYMRSHSLRFRDLPALFLIGGVLFLLISELCRPCATVGQCDSLACSFLWR